MKKAKKLKCVMCGSEEGSMVERPFTAPGEQNVTVTRPCPMIPGNMRYSFDCIYEKSKSHAIYKLLTRNSNLTRKNRDAEIALQKAYRGIAEALSGYREHE